MKAIQVAAWSRLFGCRLRAAFSRKVVRCPLPRHSVARGGGIVVSGKVVALHGRAAPKQGDAPADRGMTRARPEPTMPVAMSGGHCVFRFGGKGALSRRRGAVP